MRGRYRGLGGHAILLAVFLGAPIRQLRAADAGATSCALVFQDDFETGSIAGWEGSYGSRPTVTRRGPIDGTFSLLSDFTRLNAAEKFIPAQENVRLSFRIDLTTTGRLSTSPSPAIASLGHRAVNRDVAWVVVDSVPGGAGFTVSARAYGKGGKSEDSPSYPIPTRTALQLEWQRASGPSDGFVRLFADGNLLWTSLPTGDQLSSADALDLGNMAASPAGGTLLIDDVLLEDCSNAVGPPDAGNSGASDGPSPTPQDGPAAAADGLPPKGQGEDAGAPGGGSPLADDADLEPDARDVNVQLQVGCACDLGRRGTVRGGWAALLMALLMPTARRRRRRTGTPPP